MVHSDYVVFLFSYQHELGLLAWEYNEAEMQLFRKSSMYDYNLNILRICLSIHVTSNKDIWVFFVSTSFPQYDESFSFKEVLMPHVDATRNQAAC